MDRCADNSHQLEREMVASEALLALADGAPVDAQTLDASSLPSAAKGTRKRPVQSDDNTDGMPGGQDTKRVTRTHEEVLDVVMWGQPQQQQPSGPYQHGPCCMQYLTPHQPTATATQHLATLPGVNPAAQPHASAEMEGPGSAGDRTDDNYEQQGAPADATAAERAPPEHMGLLDVIAAAQGWGDDLVIKYCDPASRAALFQASKACQPWLLEKATKAAVTVVAHGGTSEAAWRRRLERAEQCLLLREQLQPGSDSKLVLRQATPNDDAQSGLLSMSCKARDFITEFELDQSEPYEVHKTGSASFFRWGGWDFDNLRVLRISQLCIELPRPDLWLTHLRELYVTLYDPECDEEPDDADCHESICASISVYLPQLTTLHFDVRGDAHCPELWPELFGGVTTHTLTRLTTGQELVDETVKLLVKRAPALVYLGCGSVSMWPVEDVEWSVRELGVRGDFQLELPLSPHGLAVMPYDTDYFTCRFYIMDHEGLCAADRLRLGQVRLTAPCTVFLNLESEQVWNPESVGAGTREALSQIGPYLPAGSEVHVCDYFNAEQVSCRVAAHAAVAAAAPALPHIAVWPPALLGKQDSLAIVQQEQLTSTRLCLRSHHFFRLHAQVPWRWQALDVWKDHVSASCLLALPDSGQYEIRIAGLVFRLDKKWAPKRFLQLQQRLQHWTFILETCELTIRAPQAITQQPAALRQILQLLCSFRWRVPPVRPKPELIITLKCWTLTSAVVSELRGLPRGDFAHQLKFEHCHWVSYPSVDYQHVTAVLPACYKTLNTLYKREKGPDLAFVKQLCMGAGARGAECGVLRVRVQADEEANWAWHDAIMRDEARSEVYTLIEEHNLSSCVVFEAC